MSVEKSYDQWAAQYDSMENKTRDLEKLAKQKILASIDFKNVLELGCGTGKNTVWIAEKASHILAVDFSEEMIAKAKEKIITEHVRFAMADISKLWNFTKEKFDLITCSLILEHIQDLDFVFAEAFKTLEKDGLFYICELHPFKQYLGSKARYEQDNELHILECYIHHVSDYLNGSKKAGFELKAMDEWFDSEGHTEIPRLISFLFKKNISLQQTIEIIVSGKVQGVFYRQSTKDFALKVGITGYVKNLNKGDVFIKATSTKELLDQFCEYCKSGPSKAIVSSIEIREIPVEEFNTFKIER